MHWKVLSALGAMIRALKSVGFKSRISWCIGDCPVDKRDVMMCVGNILMCVGAIISLLTGVKSTESFIQYLYAKMPLH